MAEITTLFSYIHPLLDTKTYRQLTIISQALLVMTGRITMLGISRWTDKGWKLQNRPAIFRIKNTVE